MESQACSKSPFCLGMCEWTGCEGAQGVNIEPRPQLLQSEPLLPATSASKNQRFDFASDQQLSELSKGLIPANTSKSTKWAIKTFELWSEARNKSRPQDPVPAHLLTCNDPVLLSKHLSRFAVEIRKANGDPYPPATIHQLLCGLLRHMREVSQDCPNFLDKKDSRFQQLHCTLDAHFHNLHSDGIGRQVQHAEVFTKEDEEKLWKSGVLGTNAPRCLQNAAFFTVGKMFCLRGGEEHRALKLSQVRRMTDPDRYVYTENVSKNRNGSFKHLHVKNKIVPVSACPAAGERCPVHILDLYISKLPPQAFEKDLFYVRPLEETPTDPTSPWFTAVSVGKHTLNDKVKKMCGLAGIEGRKTNHSLRATGATQMYDSGVPEKLIQERTGHRSTEALRCYERTNMQQHSAVSAVLSKPTQSSYMEQMYSVRSQKTISQQVVETKACSIPSVSFENLHGCTININTAPSHASTSSQSLVDFSEVDIDKLIAELTDPQ